MTAEDIITLTVMGSLVVCSGAISGSETALFSIEQTRLGTFAQHRDLPRRLIHRMLVRPAPLLLTILLLNNAINIAFFAIGSSWAASHADAPAAVRLDSAQSPRSFYSAKSCQR